MPDKQVTLQESISKQQELLITMLSDPLKRAAKSCSKVWGDREKLNHALTEIMHLYATKMLQFTVQLMRGLIGILLVIGSIIIYLIL